MSNDLHLDVLKNIHIASPCTMAWEDMAGDHKIRHCTQCDLNVHDFSQMTRKEIESLVLGANGRVCAMLYRRTDGTILTSDCPVGLAAIRAKTRRTAARAVALLSVLCSASVLFAQGQGDAWKRGKLVTYQPFKWAQDALAPTPPGPVFPGGLGGRVAWTPPPPAITKGTTKP